MGHHHHGHPLAGQLPHHFQHLLHHLGIEGAGGLVEEQDARLHAERTGDCHPLLLAAGQLSRILAGLLVDAHPLQQFERLALHFSFGPPAHQHRRQGEVVEHGQVRKQVELLKHHPYFAADGIDLAHIVGEGDAIHHNRALLEILQRIERADEGALAGARGTHHHHHLALGHGEVDTAQGMEAIGIPLLHPAGFDQGGDRWVGAGEGARHALALARWGGLGLRRVSRARLPSPRAAQQHQNSTASTRYTSALRPR